MKTPINPAAKRLQNIAEPLGVKVTAKRSGNQFEITADPPSGFHFDDELHQLVESQIYAFPQAELWESMIERLNDVAITPCTCED